MLPPSEGKYHPTRGKAIALDELTCPELTSARQVLIDALAHVCERPDAAEILGLGPTQAAEIEANLDLLKAPTARADRIYTGVLYDALDSGSQSVNARRRAARQLLITSSVFGIVRPADRIPAYRLAGQVSLPDLGGVAAYWRRHVGTSLEHLAGDRLLVDLRSTTYAGFWRPPAAMADHVATVRVLQERSGKRTVVSHFNKATKGRIVRELLEAGQTPRSPAELGDALADLGWHVELGAPGPGGTRLDVIVTEL